MNPAAMRLCSVHKRHGFWITELHTVIQNSKPAILLSVTQEYLSLNIPRYNHYNRYKSL